MKISDAEALTMLVCVREGACERVRVRVRVRAQIGEEDVEEKALILTDGGERNKLPSPLCIHAGSSIDRFPLLSSPERLLRSHAADPGG